MTGDERFDDFRRARRVADRAGLEPGLELRALVDAADTPGLEPGEALRRLITAILGRYPVELEAPTPGERLASAVDELVRPIRAELERIVRRLNDLITRP